MTADEELQRLVDEQLQPGEEGWIRWDDGRLVWVRVDPDGSWTMLVPPVINPPEGRQAPLRPGALMRGLVNVIVVVQVGRKRPQKWSKKWRKWLCK